MYGQTELRRLALLSGIPEVLRVSGREIAGAGRGVGKELAGGWIEVAYNAHPFGEVVVSMRPVSVFANGPEDSIEQLRADLRRRWRQARRAVTVLLSVPGLSPAQIAELLECDASTVRRWIGRFNCDGPAGLADLPRCGAAAHRRARLLARIAALLEQGGLWTVARLWRSGGGSGWVARGDPDRRRAVAAITARLRELPRGALEMTSGRWVYRLGRRCAADFIALLEQICLAGPDAPGDRGDLRRYNPHDNPVERIWAALKAFIANTAVSWPGRTDPRLLPRPLTEPAGTAAAPWTSPWLPAGYKRNFWNAA